MLSSVQAVFQTMGILRLPSFLIPDGGSPWFFFLSFLCVILRSSSSLFSTFFSPLFKDEYHSFFAPKHNARVEEGCALLIRGERFSVVDHGHFVFQKELKVAFVSGARVSVCACLRCMYTQRLVPFSPQKVLNSSA